MAALKLVKFLLNAYKNHWFASPAGAIAAVVSTVGGATAMLFISPFFHTLLQRNSAIIVDSITAPLLAYGIYLSTYYWGMFLRERHMLLDEETGELCSKKRRDWLRVVKYDYFAHLPSDTYLITLAGIMQATLEHQGSSVFWAVITSQFVDDFITFLKEPAIWGGAKELVAWENRESTTVTKYIGEKLLSKQQEHESAR